VCTTEMVQPGHYDRSEVIAYVPECFAIIANFKKKSNFILLLSKRDEIVLVGRSFLTEPYSTYGERLKTSETSTRSPVLEEVILPSSLLPLAPSSS